MKHIVKYIFIIVIYSCQTTKSIIGKYSYINKNDINIATIELKSDSSYIFVQRQGLLLFEDFGVWSYNNHYLSFFSANEAKEQIISFSIDSIQNNIVIIEVKNHLGELVLGAQCNMFNKTNDSIIVRTFYSDFNGQCYINKNQFESFEVSIPWQKSKEYLLIGDKNYFKVKLNAPTSKILPEYLIFKKNKLMNSTEKFRIVYKKL